MICARFYAPGENGQPADEFRRRPKADEAGHPVFGLPAFICVAHRAPSCSAENAPARAAAQRESFCANPVDAPATGLRAGLSQGVL